MYSLTPTTDKVDHYGISYSLLKSTHDLKSLYEYLYKDIKNRYMLFGSQFHGNMAGEKVNTKIGYEDSSVEGDDIYLSPHSVSNTYLMSYLLKNSSTYNNLICGNVMYEHRLKSYLLCDGGYKFIIRSIIDIINLDSNIIIELKTVGFFKSSIIEVRDYDMQAYIYYIMSNAWCSNNKKIYLLFIQTSYPFNYFLHQVTKQQIESGKIKFISKLKLLIEIIEENNLHHLFFSKHKN